jgi:hypothetical protein
LSASSDAVVTSSLASNFWIELNDSPIFSHGLFSYCGIITFSETPGFEVMKECCQENFSSARKCLLRSNRF